MVVVVGKEVVGSGPSSPRRSMSSWSQSYESVGCGSTLFLLGGSTPINADRRMTEKHRIKYK